MNRTAQAHLHCHFDLATPTHRNASHPPRNAYRARLSMSALAIWRSLRIRCAKSRCIGGQSPSHAVVAFILPAHHYILSLLHEQAT
jgi:hypothetical protein